MLLTIVIINVKETSDVYYIKFRPRVILFKQMERIYLCVR